MEMMNRAIEDAADFMEMKRRLMEHNDKLFAEACQGQQGHAPKSNPLSSFEKLPGENRQQYRARIRSLRKVKA